jgi:hypothetical protein
LALGPIQGVLWRRVVELLPAKSPETRLGRQRIWMNQEGGTAVQRCAAPSSTTTETCGPAPGSALGHLHSSNNEAEKCS